MSRSTATDNNGFEWRILLGPTHNWKTPELEPRNEDSNTGERCELCGELLDDAKPFVTNSAGQQPIHIQCFSGEQPSAIGRRPARKSWMRLLQSFVGA
jgi:hypothetical protein